MKQKLEYKRKTNETERLKKKCRKKIIRLRAEPRAPARTEAFPLAAKQPHGPGSDGQGEVDAQKRGPGKGVRSPARPAVGFLLLHLVLRPVSLPAQVRRLRTAW